MELVSKCLPLPQPQLRGPQKHVNSWPNTPKTSPKRQLLGFRDAGQTDSFACGPVPSHRPQMFPQHDQIQCANINEDSGLLYARLYNIVWAKYLLFEVLDPLGKRPSPLQNFRDIRTWANHCLHNGAQGPGVNCQRQHDCAEPSSRVSLRISDQKEARIPRATTQQKHAELQSKRRPRQYSQDWP